jgi:GNAT superfamily N-acetyltransferase
MRRTAPGRPNNRVSRPDRCVTKLAMRYVIRPVASLQELARVFDLAGAQLPQPLMRRDRRSSTFPADCSLMVVAEDQGRIVGGALAFRTDPASLACGVTLRLIAVTSAYRGKGLGRRLLQQVEAAAVRLGASEISLGASDAERGFYLPMGYSGRARLRKQLPLSSNARQRRAEGWRRDRDDLRRRRERRLAARKP